MNQLLNSARTANEIAKKSIGFSEPSTFTAPSEVTRHHAGRVPRRGAAPLARVGAHHGQRFAGCVPGRPGRSG